MKRSWLPALALLPGCSAPDDALVSRCTTSILSVVTECEVTATRLDQPRSSYLDANTKNFRVHVSAALSVRKGRVAVSVPGCAEGGRVEVAADKPASLECDVAINRSTYRFEVQASPVGGQAEGFAAQVKHRPI